MFKKIHQEIEEFTSTIKEVKGCDDLSDYMSSSIYASIKLLMFASKTFSMYGRVLIFFIIFLTGLMVFSTISAGGPSGILLLLVFILFVLFVLTLVYVMHWKNVLILNIKNTKEKMEDSITSEK